MQGDPLYQFLANLFDSGPLCDVCGSSEVQVVSDTPGWFLVCFRLSVLCNPVVLEYCSVILTPQHKVNQKKKSCQNSAILSRSAFKRPQKTLETMANWRILFLASIASIASGLSPDHSDYESLTTSEDNKSHSLTKELLNLDLGYNVLNSEVLRKSLVASAEVTGVAASEAAEALPQASPLIQDRNFQVSGGQNTWASTSAASNNDEKFWTGGPSPFFFPDFGFGRPRQVSVSAVRPVPFRHRPTSVSGTGNPGKNRKPTPSATRPSPPAGSGSNRNRSPAPKAFVGDQHQCGTGSCEFFLFCWLSGGQIEGSCGGFLFACCLRADGGGRNSKAIAVKVSFFWTKPKKTPKNISFFQKKPYKKQFSNE